MWTQAEEHNQHDVDYGRLCYNAICLLYLQITPTPLYCRVKVIDIVCGSLRENIYQLEVILLSKLSQSTLDK